MIDLFQLTDTHLLASPQAIDKGRLPYEQLVRAIAEINQRVTRNTVVLATGDLVSTPTPDAYQLLADVLQALKCPVYVMPGNHDDSALMKTHLVGRNIQYATEIQVKNWAVICLDSSTPGKKLGSGRLSDAELARFEAMLRLHQDKQVLVAIHHPPILFGARWFQSICLDNQAAFHAIVARHPHIKAVIFGHAHTAYTIKRGQCLYIAAPSTWIQFDHSVHKCSAYLSLPGGYNRYQLHANGDFEFYTKYINE